MEVFDDKFEILQLLGSGGFGKVYRARHLLLDREVALKVLDVPELDESMLRRFEREAKILQGFQTKLIPAVYGYGQHDGKPYMVMELLNGCSLGVALSVEDTFSLNRLHPLVCQLAGALEYAHKHGVIHRDLNPNNIFLVTDDGREEVRIIDFGLATFTATDLRNRQKLTDVGITLGSLHYMSPEQCLAEPADGRSDIYALGCIIYRTLSGQHVYDGDNAMLVMREHVNGAVPKLPVEYQELQPILDRALAKEPANRYQSAQEFLDDWKNLRCAKSTSRSPLGSSLVFLSVMLLLVAALWVIPFATNKASSQQPQQQKYKSDAAHELIQECERIHHDYSSLSEDARRKLSAHETELYEKALEINKSTDELSRRDREMVISKIALGYKRQARYHEGFLLARQALDSELKNSALDRHTVQTLADCAAENVSDLDQTVPLYYEISENPRFVGMRSIVNLYLARMLVRRERYADALEVLNTIHGVPGEWGSEEATFLGITDSLRKTCKEKLRLE